MISRRTSRRVEKLLSCFCDAVRILQHAVAHLGGVDHECPRRASTVGLVPDAQAGEDDARLQVVLVRVRRHAQVVLATGLDDGRVDPVRVGEVNVGKLGVLVPQLHVGRLVVVADLLLDQLGERLVGDLRAAVDQRLHLGLEVLLHARRH
jgi:hypothetical protein